MKNPSWYADLKAESDLKRMAVAFEIVKVKFSQLDLRESQINGARFDDAIVERKVEDYIQGFQNGDTFPRPVIRKGPSGYVILSGNQRCEALNRLAREGELPKTVEIEAYLVDTADKNILDLIARAANVAHGEGISVEQRIQHAVHCVRSLGYAHADAAKFFVVSQQAIRTNINAEEIRESLQASGVNAHRAPVHALAALKRLDFDEGMQLKLGTLVVQHGIPAERVKQVAAAMAKKPNTQSRIQDLKELEKECTAAAHSANGHANGKTEGTDKVPKKPRRDELQRRLSGLVNFLEQGNAGEPFSTLDQLQVTTNQDVERAQALIKKLRYRLGVLAR